MENYKINSVPLSRLALAGPVTRKNILEFQLPETDSPAEFTLTINNNHLITDPCQQTHIPSESLLEKWLSDLEQNPHCCIEFPAGFYDLDAARTAKVLHALKEEKEFVRKELLYLSSSTRRPNCLSMEFDIPALCHFADLIHNSVVATDIPDYQMTPSELAQLCGSRHLSDSHMCWVTEKLNSMQTDVMCLYINLVDNINNFSKATLNRSQQTKLLLLVNVGFNINGTTLIESSNHFSIAIYDDKEKTIMYGDSLGWPPPQDLLTMINKFTLHMFDSETSSIQLFHSTDKTTDDVHLCNNDCKPYFPLQTDNNNVCGVVVIILASIICLSPHTWTNITEQTESPYFYLAKPSIFDKYLRMVLMIWFSTGQINLEYIIPTHWTGFVEEESDDLDAGSEYAGICHDTPQVSIDVDVLETRNGEDLQNNDNNKNNDLCLSTIEENVRRPTTSDTTILCDLCLANFSSRSNLRRHMKRKHKAASVQQQEGDISNDCNESDDHANSIVISVQPPQDENDNDDTDNTSSIIITDHNGLCLSTTVDEDMNGVSSNTTIRCDMCRENFANQSSLKRHIKRKHKDVPVQQQKGNASHCLECGMQFYKVSDMKNHLVEAHGFSFPTEVFKHKSLEEFELWKLELERKNSCSLTCSRGKVMNKKGETVMYFRCNRSGYYVPSYQKRKKRQCGTRKIDNNCTASLQVTRHKNGTYTTECCLVHYGHQTELHHLNVPKDLKQQIAAKLRQGLPQSTILDQVRQNIQEEFLTRGHILKRKDIWNVANRAGIKIEQPNKKGRDNELKHDDKDFSSLKSRTEDQILRLLSSVRQSNISDKDFLRQVLHSVIQITNSFEASKKD